MRFRMKRTSEDRWKQNKNTRVSENILLRFLRDENRDFWKRISEAGGMVVKCSAIILACSPALVKSN